MFIDVSGEAVRIDGSLARYGGRLVNDFRKADRAHAAAQPAGLFMVCRRRLAATMKIRERSAPSAVIDIDQSTAADSHAEVCGGTASGQLPPD
jgi:hypothetical protein